MPYVDDEISHNRTSLDLEERRKKNRFPNRVISCSEILDHSNKLNKYILGAQLTFDHVCQQLYRLPLSLSGSLIINNISKRGMCEKSRLSIINKQLMNSMSGPEKKKERKSIMIIDEQQSKGFGFFTLIR